MKFQFLLKLWVRFGVKVMVKGNPVLWWGRVSAFYRKSLTFDLIPSTVLPMMIMRIIEQLPVKETLRKSLLTSMNMNYAVINGKRRSIERLKAFAVHGCTCVRCGNTGNEIIVWEANDGATHVDLFFRDKKGRPVMMTRDHIIPKSKKGLNNIFNYQPMCCRCNLHKGCNETQEDINLSVFRNRWKDIYYGIHDRVISCSCNRIVGRFYPHIKYLMSLYLHRVSWVIAKISS